MSLIATGLNIPNLGTSNASAPTVLAASATVTRYVRGFIFTNNTSTPCTVNFGIGTAAIMTAANSILFGATLGGVGTSISNVFTKYYPGKGLRLLTRATDVIMAFASAANVTLEVIYDESSGLDA